MKIVELVVMPDGTAFNFRYFMGLRTQKVHEGEYTPDHKMLYVERAELLLRDPDGSRSCTMVLKCSLAEAAKVLTEAGEKWGRK